MKKLIKKIQERKIHVIIKITQTLIKTFNFEVLVKKN